MVDDLVGVRVEAHVATLTLNRPDRRNALSRAMLHQVLDALAALERDDQVRVLVLTGAGPAFCAGIDLAEMLDERRRHGEVDFHLLPDVFERLARHPNPTLAVVQGAAVAGGCELALHCDIRIGSPESRFVMPLARLGLVAPPYAIARLIEVAGPTGARDMLLTGEAIEGEAAARLGLLTRLAPAGALRDHGEALARRIASGAPLALREMKRAIGCLTPSPHPDILAELAVRQAQAGRSEDVQEGLRAFLERRPPVFRGA